MTEKEIEEMINNKLEQLLEKRFPAIIKKQIESLFGRTVVQLRLFFFNQIK